MTPRVLITRPAEQAWPLAKTLDALGMTAVVAPLIATRTATDSTTLHTALMALANGVYEWLGITSRATVRALIDASADGQVTIPAATSVAVVGPGTAQAVEEAGWTVRLLPPGPSFSGLALADAWPPAARMGECVLLPRSVLADDVLPEALRAKGYTVDTVTAYHTEPVSLPDHVRRAIIHGGFDAIVLGSASAADALAHQLGDSMPSHLPIVCLGEPTAEAARAAGLPVAAIAHTPADSDVANAIKDLCTPSSPTTNERVETMPEPTPPTRQSETSRARRRSAAPTDRPRRLRATPALRRLVAEVRVDPADLVLPLFVREGVDEPIPVTSMPGVVQHTMTSVRQAAEEAVATGVGGLMVFGVPAHRDPVGSGATDPEGILNRAMTQLARDLGYDTVLMADLCLDEFTDHGHCGVLDEAGRVDNDATLLRYQDMARALADAGAHLVGTSGMMDGQVAAVRSALDADGAFNVGILGYAAKFASAFYGPFREAVDSQLTGDRRSYQQDPANARDAGREIRLDLAEGADIIMVKPAMAYLDVVAQAARLSDVPVAAYQVSGEFAMIEAAAANGWIDRDAAIIESLTCLRRAGASIVLTYWAAEVARGLGGRI